MTDAAFQTLWNAALEADDCEAYVAEYETDPGLKNYKIVQRKEKLEKIWTVAHTPIKDMIAQVGLNQSSFGRLFCVPLRTVQGWCSSAEKASRGCPDYFRLAVARHFNLL